MAAIHNKPDATTVGQLCSRQRVEHHRLVNMGVSALFRFIVTVAFASVASCATSPPKLRQVVESPRNWVNLGRAPSSHVIPLRIGLPQSRFSELEQHLAEISDPFHPSYGKHLSKEDVEALVAPDANSIEAVHDWLGSHGVQKDACHHSPAGDWVTVHLPVAQVEKMLGTEFSVWEHTEDGNVLVRTTQYSLPHHLDEHIELIQPTTAFNRAKAQRTTNHFTGLDNAASSQSSGANITVPGYGVTVDASCNNTTTVSCLKQLYNAIDYTPKASDKNAIALTGYLGQFANFADLQNFYEDQVPAAVNTSFDVVLINSGLNNQTLTAAGIEADLNVQFALGISFPTPGTFYSTGGSPPVIPDAATPNSMNEPFLDWLDFILVQHTIPQVISTSYGDDEQTVTMDYARRVCQGFAQLGARGVSLIFASGDAGVGGVNPNLTQICLTNDGTNQTKFQPVFPASCPYVTTVGATNQIPEIAADFSGGGFSNHFPRPLWQEAAVTKFLASIPNGTYVGLFNHSGRAYPDVSTHGTNFLVTWRGHLELVSGTSTSAPTFAAFVALLNDARLAAGKSALGFLSPLLYALGGAGLHDITVGNAPGCGTLGFNATTGWDPVTGLGTPDFEVLKRIVLDI